MKPTRFLVPLIGFALLVGFLAVGLKHRPSDLPSPLVDKVAPPFQLPALTAASPPVTVSGMRGKVWLLNVWATWCVSCRDEHPVLLQYRATAKDSGTALPPMVGLSYKEVRGDAAIEAPAQYDAELALARERANAWLAAHGNPYDAVALDLDGKVGIDYGVYGVPETYLIDKNGVIRLKHIGPLTPEVIEGKLLPMVVKLGAS